MKQKWEYQILDLPKPDGLLDQLNKAGEEGWELVQIVGTTYFFKREVQRQTGPLGTLAQSHGRKFR